MEVWVTGQPHLLYETVELLFAYVNRIPAVELTQEGPYCLPEAAIQQMLDVACAGISQDDPEIQYDWMMQYYTSVIIAFYKLKNKHTDIDF